MEENAEDPVPSDIHDAAFYGDLNMVNLFVQRGSEINGYSELGLTPLHYAVLSGDIDTIVHLVGLGAAVDMGTRYKNQTPAHWAARIGRGLCLHLLSRLGASLTVQDNTTHGKMPIHTAVKYDRVEVILWMLEMGVSVNIKDREGGTPLFYAIHFGYTHLVQLFIQEGADVNVRYTGFNNVTPLHIAVSEGNLDIIGMLLRNGANMYTPCSAYKETPVHRAARDGKVEILELMFQFGSILSVQTDDQQGDRPIHVAAKKGHLPVVMWLVGKGASVNCTNSRGYTPLHVAVCFDQFDTALYLLQEGSQVYARTNNPELCTPLNIAAWCGKLDMIDLLIHYGANVNAGEQNNGFTPLHHAVHRDNLECLKHLKRNGGNIMVHMGSERGEPLIITAIRYGSETVTRWLLETEVSVNVKLKDGRTPLHHAAHYGKSHMALLLLKRGANVNCKDDHSGTPLHYAVLRGHADLTGLLISWKADIEVRNIHGMDSLHLAAFDSEPYCLQLLSLSGGNLMTQTSHDPGDLLIHIAVKQKHENVIRWLIEHGMPVDVPNRIGVTALIYASELGLYNVARLLINNGANVNVRFSSHDNSTPLHLTCAGGNKELAKLLIENGADINARTSSDGRTPLHWAVESQHHALIQLLIRYGPDLRVKDSLGYTAARLAECKCYYPIFNFLKEVEDEITPLS